jgi:hypothetical protein
MSAAVPGWAVSVIIPSMKRKELTPHNSQNAHFLMMECSDCRFGGNSER